MVSNKLKKELRNSWKTLHLHIGEVKYPPGFTYQLDKREDHQLFLHYEGEVTMHRDGEIHTIPPGQVTYLHPSESEYWEFDKETNSRHSWICLHPSLMTASLRKRLKQAPFTQSCLLEIQTIFDILKRFPHEIDTETETMLNHYGISAFEHYLYCHQTSQKQGAANIPLNLKRAETYVQENYLRSIDLADLAKAACISPKHLNRLFQKYLKITPMRYIWRFRIQHASRLLANTQLNISQISEQSGFQNPYHFSRLFKQHYGVSPKFYRNSQW